MTSEGEPGGASERPGERPDANRDQARFRRSRHVVTRTITPDMDLIGQVMGANGGKGHASQGCMAFVVGSLGYLSYRNQRQPSFCLLDEQHFLIGRQRPEVVCDEG